jgi:ABC-2 type transport system permease protein
MRLFAFEMKSAFKSLLVWNICIVGFMMFSMSMFPSFADMGSSLDDMMAGFPPEMSKAFRFDVIDFTDPMDYICYMFQYFLIAMGSLAILTGGNIISKEESDQTIDFLYAQPVTRLYIAGSKIAAAFAQMMITAVLFFVGTWGILEIVTDDYDFNGLVLLCVGIVLFMMLFTSIGLLLGHFIVKPGRRLPFALGIVFVFFFLDIMGKISEDVKAMLHITPYHWFDGIELIENGYSPVYLAVTIGIIVIGCGLTGLLYTRKDFT